MQIAIEEAATEEILSESRGISVISSSKPVKLPYDLRRGSHLVE